MKLTFNKFADRRAFTLMELMIVILIIGILMGGVFMLMGVAARHGDIAKTRSKVQRLQNAVSGFYAAYGTYPPVDNCYGPLDPFSPFQNDFDDTVNSSSNLDDPATKSACRWACRAQPVAFEFPCPQDDDAMINLFFNDASVRSPNEVFANAASINSSDWATTKMFKFGLMSFLLPRITMVGIPTTGNFNNEQPLPDFYETMQWNNNNKKSVVNSGALVDALRSQSDVECRAVAKWLPNLEGMCTQLNRSIMNISLNDSKSYFYDDETDAMVNAQGGDSPYRGPYKYGSQKTVLECATVKDSWNRDLFYYSAPPYQSYRIWSAGPNGLTFPPWIPLESLSETDQALVAEWIKDDIAGID